MPHPTALAAAVAAATAAALAAIPPAAASRGDAQHDYQTCVADCAERTPCGRPPAVVLGVWPWPCRDECQYYCMHEAEARRARQGLNVLQYHGKWPFARAWGVQE